MANITNTFVKNNVGICKLNYGKENWIFLSTFRLLIQQALARNFTKIVGHEFFLSRPVEFQCLLCRLGHCIGAATTIMVLFDQWWRRRTPWRRSQSDPLIRGIVIQQCCCCYWFTEHPMWLVGLLKPWIVHINVHTITINWNNDSWCLFVACFAIGIIPANIQ